LVLSAAQRAHWLGPDLYADDTVALELALIQAAASVQLRGPHALDVQVARSLARTAQQRRDQDRRYREARAAGGGSSSARPPWGAKAGHRPTGGEAPPEATQPYVARPGGGYIYGRAAEDPDAPLWYRPSTPEAQAYIARAERDGECEGDIARYRQRGVRLRPSEARRIVTGGAVGSQPFASIAGPILARAAAHHAQGATP
jgi:hypothetical protein